MSNTPTVAVIMPTYNGLPYIKDAIASVQSQDFKDWSLYVIDDGSTDKTREYVEGISDKRVHYIKVKNSGPSAARNKGVAISNSKYVAFLDADDVWLPNKLSAQLRLIQPNPGLGLVYGHQYMINANGARIGRLKAKLRGHVFSRLLTGNRIAGSASMVLIKRSALEEVGGFLVDYAIGEDWELWLRIANGHTVDYVDDFLIEVRELPDSSQRKYLRNAQQLLGLGDYIASEFKLRGLLLRRLKSHLLLHAALAYYSGEEQTESKAKLLQALKTNPLVLARYNMRTWQLSFRILIYKTIIWRYRHRNEVK